jgi:hypothetical protein
MSTIKDLYNNEEFLNNIVEDIDDIPEDAEVLYAVWALGYNKDDDITDTEVLVGEFTNPDEAVACAENLTIKAIDELGYEKPDNDTAYFSVEVETVVGDPDDEDGGTMNIGTAYQRNLWIDGEYCSEDCLEEMLDELVEVDPIIAITAEDYELLEDGALKVRCDLLKGFNKNDYLRLQFVGEPESVPVLTYKIMSKVIYEDGDYYHLEFEY